MKTRMMVLISILLMVSISCQGLADVLPGGGANPNSFTAEATSAISAQLTWSAVEGAQKYLIERNDGETDYFTLAEIPGETTSFEDFLVPSKTQISYRINTVTASGTSAGKTVSLTTPQEFPNPLTVVAMFDTQNAHSQAIDTDGGSVSITDSKGVRYTLDIPASALDNEVTFTLTPIQDIHGLPLSGGMTSGVRIEPEGLIFNQSATLSIETTEADAADGMMDMAFAFDGEGSEFHFVPSSSAAVSGAVFKLAHPASVSSWNVINIPQTRSYGNGQGTSNDIRNQVRNHAPTSPADNLNQKMAVVENFQVQVVLDALLLNSGRDVELQMAGASDWLEFTIALDTFKSWLDERDAIKETLKKDQLDKREEAIWEALDLEARILLNTSYEDCKKAPPAPPNLSAAKRLVNNLLNGTTPFYRKFAEKMAKYSSYDELVLKGIKATLDKCSTSYKVSATSRWYFPGLHEFDIVAMIENAVMNADEQGNFTGTTTVNWTVATTVIHPNCNSVNYTVTPSQTDLTGQMDDSGLLVVNLTYQPAAGSATQVCRTLAGTDTYTYYQQLAPDPLSFSVASSGGAFNQSQVLVVTALPGTSQSLSGSSAIVVVPEGEVVAFNTNNHEASWDDFSSLFGVLLALR